MAKKKPEYEVNDEFNLMMRQIVEKHTHKFSDIDPETVCCVSITNKDKPEARNKLWELIAVKMPVRLHCMYAWYVVVYSSDWDALPEKNKLILVAEILNGIGDEEGKVNSFDSKGYKLMQRTFKGIDYLYDPDVPHLLNDEIEWVDEPTFSR